MSSFLLMPISLDFSSRMCRVSDEIRMEITSFSGLRAINFAKMITFPLAYCILFWYN